MKFTLGEEPPSSDEIASEREQIKAHIRLIKKHDLLIAFLLIVGSSVVLGLAVYWTTGNLRDAAFAASVFPILGAALSLTGLVTAAGFRSTTVGLVELNNNLIALNPVSEADKNEIVKLSSRYDNVQAYCEKAQQQGRDLVNGELAMFWDWDSSTLAKQDKRKDFVDRARDSVHLRQQDAD